MAVLCDGRDAFSDALAEEREGLRRVLSVLNAPQAEPNTKTNTNININTTGKAVAELPRLLRCAAAPAALRRKEAQRQSATRAGIARRPPLTGATALFRLLFGPVARDTFGGRSEVLESVARLAMRPARVGESESEGGALGDSLAAAAFCALREIIDLCAAAAGDAARGPLLRALRDELWRSGLFAHIWRALIFRPLADAARVPCAAVVFALCAHNILHVRDAARALCRESFADAVAARILCDPCAFVRGVLIAVLRGGAECAFPAISLSHSARRRLLGAVAANAFQCPRESRAVAALLCDAMRADICALRGERERESEIEIECARGGNARGKCAEDAAAVCAAALARNITARFRFPRDFVRLLRLALRVSDELTRRGECEGAGRIIHLCVAQRGLCAALAGGLNDGGEKSAARAEMIRLARDIFERAAGPLCDAAPFVPLMLQNALAAHEENAHDHNDEGEKEEENEKDKDNESEPLLGGPLCARAAEALSLFGAALWRSPEMRRRAAETFAAVCRSALEWRALFDALESAARALPLDIFRDFLIVDAAGAVLSEPRALFWPDGAREPPPHAIAPLLQKKPQKNAQMKVISRDATEEPRHSRAARALICFIISHMRASGAAAVSPISPISPISPRESRADSPRTKSESHKSEESQKSENSAESEKSANWQISEESHKSEKSANSQISEESHKSEKSANSQISEESENSAGAENAVAHLFERRAAAAAAEQSACLRALRLFAALAARYYRHCLSPADAAAFAAKSDRPKVKSAARRLWTPRDVRRGDLFRFALSLAEITAAALGEIVSRARTHFTALRLSLRTAPRAPCGRRFFLEDAKKTIAGRVVALLQILQRAVQREGAGKVRGALAQLPDTNGGAFTLHCGNLLEAARLVVQCFENGEVHEREEAEWHKETNGGHQRL